MCGISGMYVRGGGVREVEAIEGGCDAIRQLGVRWLS